MKQLARALITIETLQQVIPLARKANGVAALASMEWRSNGRSRTQGLGHLVHRVVMHAGHVAQGHYPAGSPWRCANAGSKRVAHTGICIGHFDQLNAKLQQNVMHRGVVWTDKRDCAVRRRHQVSRTGRDEAHPIRKAMHELVTAKTMPAPCSQ